MPEIDYDTILKYYPKQKDYKRIGAIIMTRYMTRFPEYHVMFPRVKNIPQIDLGYHEKTALLGVHKLVQTRELLKARGKHESLARPVAIIHITRCRAPMVSFQRLIYIFGEVFAEELGMDPAGQHHLRMACQRIWDDFEVTYREMGIPT